ncbi:transcriptional repressor [bacterium]|nr:transcriptional repressor [bacterium]
MKKNMAQKTLPCGRPIAVKKAAMTDARLEEYKQMLRNYLSNAKLKWTRQRWAMAKLILKTADHMDAQEIVERVRKVDKNIGVATVYRNIKVLCDAGILSITHQGIDGNSRYEIQEKGHHDHIICLDCNEILEFHDDKMDELQRKTASKMGFQVEDHRNVIHGHCKYLKKKK